MTRAEATARTRTGRAGARAAWVPWLVTLALVTVSLLLPQDRPVEVDPYVGTVSLVVLLYVQSLTFATVGLVILRAQPRHAIGWLFAAVGILVAFYQLVERYQFLAITADPGRWPLGELAAWLQAWTYVPALAITISLIPQLFPTGRPVSPRWRWLLWVAAISFVGVAAVDATRPGRLDTTPVQNPYALGPQAYAWLTGVSMSLYYAVTVLGFVTLVVRWRRADHATRQQIKLFVFAAALVPAFVSLNALTNTFGDAGLVWVHRVAIVVAAGAFLGFPIATGVSIVRHRLFDIDLVINRTLVYFLLTASLVATYLGSVLVFRAVVEPALGGSDIAVAVSTLTVAGLFRPLRRRIQRVVDRRFYRSRYDAARTLERFSDRLRHQVDLDALGTDLRHVVRETMQPEHVSVWLREPTR